MTHECLFAEEQEPSGRLILGPCLTCGLSAMDAMAEIKQRIHLILSTIYSVDGYISGDGEIDTAAKFRAIERLARLDWDDDGMSDVIWPTPEEEAEHPDQPNAGDLP